MLGAGLARRRGAPLALVAAVVFVSPAPAGSAPQSGVAALQVALRTRGLYAARIDGLIGPKTVAAVRAFQRRRSIVVDGIPGPQTRGALGAYGRYRLGERVLSYGAFGWDVAETQFLLRLRGYRLGGLDASLGGRTEMAIRRFQSRAHLAPDGVVGPRTLAALDGRTLAHGRSGLTRGQALRARSGGAVVVIRTAAHRLYLYHRARPIRVFAVSTGSTRWPTPRGHLQIVLKQRHPWWYPPRSRWAKGKRPIPPGPGNPLGTRWMGLSVPGVGIHGTPDPVSLGYSVSHGCVRMKIRDAEWLYRHVRVGTRVWIL